MYAFRFAGGDFQLNEATGDAALVFDTEKLTQDVAWAIDRAQLDALVGDSDSLPVVRGRALARVRAQLDLLMREQGRNAERRSDEESLASLTALRADPVYDAKGVRPRAVGLRIEVRSRAGIRMEVTQVLAPGRSA